MHARGRSGAPARCTLQRLPQIVVSDTVSFEYSIARKRAKTSSNALVVIVDRRVAFVRAPAALRGNSCGNAAQTMRCAYLRTMMRDCAIAAPPRA